MKINENELRKFIEDRLYFEYSAGGSLSGVGIEIKKIVEFVEEDGHIDVELKYVLFEEGSKTETIDFFHIPVEQYQEYLKEDGK